MSQKPKNIGGRFLKRSRLLLNLVLIAFLIASFFWWAWATRPVASGSQPTVKFIIPKGSDLSTIAWLLKKEGLIKSPLAFKLVVLAQGQAGSIQAGSFSLSPALTPKQITQQLTHGTTDIWITFPEGWRQEEYAQRLGANLINFNQEEFLDLVKDKEGQLFPDTYLFPLEATPQLVVRVLTDNFKQKFSSELQAQAASKDLTQDQVLILASIVEREENSEVDQPKVAGILLKRWRNDWPLQVDASLQYIKASLNCRSNLVDCDWWPKALAEDKNIDSTYNTYKYKGLPPGPICNPGLASIEAVINSQETDAWFYLSDSQGRTYYAQTSEEHQQNIINYLR